MTRGECTEREVDARLREARVPPHRAQRRDIEAQIAALPPPVESNVEAFDQAAERLLPFSEVIRETTPEHQRAIVAHIVERVIIEDRQVTDITVRLEARPFFSDLRQGQDGVWRWRPRTVLGALSQRS